MKTICTKTLIHICSFLLLTSYFSLIYAQAPDTLWTKTYGGADDDRGYSVKQTIDGGFIVGGETNSFGDEHGYLIKTDQYGDTMWTRTYRGAITSVLQTYDGGYIFTGTIGHIYIVRTDSFGDTLWTRVIIPSNHSSRAEEIQPTSDSCYIIVGTATDYISNEYFNVLYLLKIDDDGDTLWTKKYGQLYSFGHSVYQTDDDGYVVTGRWLFSSYLMKTDPLGDSLWLKLWDGGRIYSVRQTLDAGYILAGEYGASQDIYIIKTDSLGDTLWTRKYGGSNHEWGMCIRENHDGSFIITGATMSSGAGLQDVYLLKISNTGDSLWASAYGGTGYDFGHEVEITSDSGYIIAGYTESYGAGGNDVYLIKIAPDTFSVEEAKGDVITNHSFGASIINGPLLLPEGKTCKIFDITGRVVMPDKIKPGIYFIEIDGKITQKVVKVR